MYRFRGDEFDGAVRLGHEVGVDPVRSRPPFVVEDGAAPNRVPAGIILQR